ncbi:MAG: serine dehydratase subunit alpha family protein, partial [Oscillospiraceae bacterium]
MYHLESYINIIKEEVVVSVGCTEPIAVAYIAAKATELLGEKPDKIIVECSANIIKNAKSVSIPNCKELKGIVAATVVGSIVKNSEKSLRLLENVSEKVIEEARETLQKDHVKLKLLETVEKLHIITNCYFKDEYAKVEIKGAHTNIVKMEKNGEVVFKNIDNISSITDVHFTDRGILYVKDICEFVKNVDIELIKPLLRDA